MPLRTYSTGMRVRLALGVVTSIDPEILLLDEGIGAVDAEFLAKARIRLNELVERSGILVFASHSDEFLADLCDTAIWMDQGQIREHGPLREVLHHYKGRDVLAELESRSRRRCRRSAVVAVVVTRHRTETAGRRPGLAGQADPPDRAPHRRRQRAGPVGARGRRRVRAAATWLPSWRNLGGAGGFALGMLHALALGADWVWLADDDGRAADDHVLATLRRAGRPARARGRLPHRADADDPDRLAFPRAPRPHLAPVARRAGRRRRARRRPRAPARDRRAVQRRAVPDVHAGRHRGAGPAAVHPRRRGGDAPAARALRPAVRHGAGRGVPAPAGRRRRQADAARATCTPATPTTR